MKKYEATIILAKKIDDAEIDKQMEPVKQAVEKLGGQVAAATRMGRYSFARPFNGGKHNGGIYVLLSFSMPPDKIETFRDDFKYNDNIVRIQIVVAKEIKEIKEAKETKEAEA